MDQTEEFPDELYVLLQPGCSIRLLHGDGSTLKLLHIRAIVDQDQLVTREWWYHHKRWNYEIESIWIFELWWKNGRLKKA